MTCNNYRCLNGEKYVLMNRGIQRMVINRLRHSKNENKHLKDNGVFKDIQRMNILFPLQVER